MATSVKKENRWKRQLQASNDADSDSRCEVEAAFLVRGTRTAPVPSPQNHTRKQVRNWMRRNVGDGFETATELAEAANAALRLPPDSMDDDGHWVWEEAMLALELVNA